MDSRLVLAVVLATFAWMSVGTSAQNNTTPASMSNMTTASMSNMTTASMSNMTTASMSNMTTAAGGNTVNANTTAAPATTTAAPLTFNDTVVPLLTNISKAECGGTQLCAALPSDCDPSNGNSCFFISTMQTSGQNFEFQLSGESDGYIAAILSTDTTLGGNDTAYVCANDNGTVKFIGALLSNSVLTVTTLNVNSVKGAVRGRTIQCTFAATVSNSARSVASTSFSLAVATGNFTNGTLGAPETQFQTNVVNLADPKANVTLNNATETTATPTTATTTASHAITLQHSLSQALLIILGVLGLTLLY